VINDVVIREGVGSRDGAICSSEIGREKEGPPGLILGARKPVSAAWPIHNPWSVTTIDITNHRRPQPTGLSFKQLPGKRRTPNRNSLLLSESNCLSVKQIPLPDAHHSANSPSSAVPSGLNSTYGEPPRKKSRKHPMSESGSIVTQKLAVSEDSDQIYPSLHPLTHY